MAPACSQTKVENLAVAFKQQRLPSKERKLLLQQRLQENGSLTTDGIAHLTNKFTWHSPFFPKIPTSDHIHTLLLSGVPIGMKPLSQRFRFT